MCRDCDWRVHAPHFNEVHDISTEEIYKNIKANVKNLRSGINTLVNGAKEQTKIAKKMKGFLVDLQDKQCLNERVSSWAFNNSLEQLQTVEKVCEDMLKKLDKTKKAVQNVKKCAADLDQKQMILGDKIKKVNIFGDIQSEPDSEDEEEMIREIVEEGWGVTDDHRTSKYIKNLNKQKDKGLNEIKEIPNNNVHTNLKHLTNIFEELS